MQYCCAIGCFNYKSKPDCRMKSFCRLPEKNPELLKAWIENIQRDDYLPSDKWILCSDHFVEDSFKECPFTKRKTLKRDAIPTIFRKVTKKKLTDEELRLQPVAIKPPDMTFKCSVPGCRSNYEDGSPKMSIFSFPRNKSLHQRWIKSMPVENFKSYKYSKVCELHFEPDQIIREASGYDPKTCRTLTAPLAIPRLRKGAVPTRFPTLSGPLVKPKMDPDEREIPSTETTLKETEKLDGNQQCKLLRSDTGTESENVAESSAVIKQEPVESTDESAPPPLLMDNILVLKELIPSSNNSSLSNTGPPSLSLRLFTSSPLSSSLPSSNSLKVSSSLPSSSTLPTSSNMPPTTNLSSSSSSPSSNSLKVLNSLPSSSSLPTSSNMPPTTNLSSSSHLPPTLTSPFVIGSFPFANNGFPAKNPDSTNVEETSATNKRGLKRKVNILKVVVTPSATQAKLHQPTISPMPFKSHKKRRRISKKPVEPTDQPIDQPTEDAANATREMFQSLLNGSENNPLFGSGTSERPGDLFDVFADFIAQKLREMNWDNCAIALRSILDIVFKAGEAGNGSSTTTDQE